MKILAISGSLRQGSHNTDLLRGAAAAAPDGVDIELYHGLKDIPPYDADDDIPGDHPEAVDRFKEALADADAILISTPEYNSSIPGVLKNGIDWVSRPRDNTPFQGKPAAVVGATTGQFGAVWAQAELRKVLRSTGARVVDLELPVARGHHALERRGALLDEIHGPRSAEILNALITEIQRDRESALVA